MTCRRSGVFEALGNERQAALAARRPPLALLELEAGAQGLSVLQPEDEDPAAVRPGPVGLPVERVGVGSRVVLELAAPVDLAGRVRGRGAPTGVGIRGGIAR